MNSLGNVGFVGTFVVGLLKDATGSTRGAFLAFAALALLTAGLCLVLRRHTVFTSRSTAYA